MGTAPAARGLRRRVGRRRARASIFVSIAAYRDPECTWTIRDLYRKARHPGRVFVGVCWQGRSPEDDGLFRVTVRPRQVRCVRHDARRSRGACWAKSQAQRLSRGEDYLLSIDSHMRFAPDWDVSMIDLLSECPSPKPILSTYVAGYRPPDRRWTATPHLVAKEFHRPTGLLLLRLRLFDLDAPRRGAFVSGHFMFSSAALMREVPYDPHLYFYGEEISMAVRAWTWGWDVFTPHRCLIHHYYDHPSTVRRHWLDHEDWWKLDRVSVARVKHLLGVEPSRSRTVTVGLAGRYGLGSVRTLEGFQRFAGVDFKRRLITRRARLGAFDAPAGGGRPRA